MAWPTNADIGTRLARTLSTAEEDQADLLLEQAVAAVADACGRDDDWAAALTPIPAALAGIVIEAVARAISAPVGVRSSQETLGTYSHSESYTDALAYGVQLTPAEERRARRIVFGSNTGSATLPNVLDELYDLS